MEHFDSLFNPESVAVVGASNAPQKWGAGVFSSVLRTSTVKKLYAVNNTTPEVQGVKTYPSVRDLPEPVDFVAIVVPFNYVLDVVKDCVARGAKSALIITAGLGETGPEGEALQKEIVSTAREGGLRLVGPNCMGHFNTTNQFSTVRMGMNLDKGNIGVISESGGFAGHILQCGTEMGVGFSKFVSYGNACDVDESDLLSYLGEDGETKVVTLYVEGVKEGRKFFSVAKNVSKKKPIIAIKGGLSAAGFRDRGDVCFSAGWGGDPGRGTAGQYAALY